MISFSTNNRLTLTRLCLLENANQHVGKQKNGKNKKNRVISAVRRKREFTFVILK